MFEKSISSARQAGAANDKPRTGDTTIRMARRMVERQRAERERRDRYGRFGGR